MTLLSQAENEIQPIETIDPVGMADPTPDTIPPVEHVPPTTDDPFIDQQPTIGAGDPTLQDLYPEAPIAEGPGTVDVPDATAASVTEADLGVANVDSSGQTVTGEQTSLTAEQQVDAELARILGQDSPLLAQARAEAMRMANQRGLMNSSMAAGMTYGELVKAAMPMAQQNAAQGFQRESQNTGFRQEANIFSASQQQEAARLEAQMRTALEQGNQEAYNQAALQYAELQRNAEAQQAELDFAAEQQRAAEQQAYNQQVIDGVTRLNEQYLEGSQAMDLQQVASQYQLLIQTNETAGSMYQAGINAIASIMSNPNMTPAQIASAIQVVQQQMEAGLRMIGEINNMDFGETVPATDTDAGGVPVPGPGTEPPIPPDATINT